MAQDDTNLLLNENQQKDIDQLIELMRNENILDKHIKT